MAGEIVGRAWELEYLGRRLKRGPVVVMGPPGIGKTALGRRLQESDRYHRLVDSNLDLQDRRRIAWDYSGTIFTSRNEVIAPLSTAFDRTFRLRELLLEDAIHVASQRLKDGTAGDVLVMDLVRTGVPLSPLFLHAACDLLQSGRQLADFLPLFRYYSADSLRDVVDAVLRSNRVDAIPCLVAPDGSPLSRPALRRLSAVVRSVASSATDLVRANPDLLEALSPRQFEEVVADLFAADGFEVSLTAASKDGGRDVIAARHDKFGSFLYLIECKKYSPMNPVGVEVVRNLYAVVAAERATAGVVATTSTFTHGARAFAGSLQHQMSLRDVEDVRGWLGVTPPGVRL